jgi:hypothetical protein
MSPLARDTAEELIALYNAFGAVDQVNAIGTTTTAGVTLPDPTVNAINTATLSGATPFTLPASAVGKKLRLLLTQDATGSRTPTFTTAAGTTDTIIKVGGAVTLSTTAAALDIVTFECYVAGVWVESGQLNAH